MRSTIGLADAAVAAYLRYLKSHVADIANAGSRMAGAVTAALYWKVHPDGQRWAHLDVYAPERP